VTQAPAGQFPAGGQSPAGGRAPAGGQAPAQGQAPAGRPAPKYLLTYHSVADFAPLARQHFPAHYARLVAFRERGDLLLVGTLAEPVNGDALAVFTSRQAAEEFVAEDPFVLNKVVASYTIRPWHEIFYQPGQDGRGQP
jgi:uncharacterized protein YciI